MQQLKAAVNDQAASERNNKQLLQRHSQIAHCNGCHKATLYKRSVTS
jgi:hypothetical protein